MINTSEVSARLVPSTSQGTYRLLLVARTSINGAVQVKVAGEDGDYDIELTNVRDSANVQGLHVREGKYIDGIKLESGQSIMLEFEVIDKRRQVLSLASHAE